MRRNRYRLRDGVTWEDIEKLNPRDGGSWIIKNSKKFIGKYYRKDSLKITINIAFQENLSVWNDIDNTLVIDEDFCQPYTAFYAGDKARVTNEYALWSIERYNALMDSIPVLERVMEE